MKVGALVVVPAVCAATASLASASRGAEQLTITVRGSEYGDRGYTLGCDPAEGTVPDPAAACAALGAQPDLVQPHPGQDHRCPPSPRYEIGGTFQGAAVAASFSACVSGQEDGLAVWSRLVPYEVPALRGRATLKVDRGLGPLRLGQRVDAVEHGAGGQLLGESRVAYWLGRRGVLNTEYGSDLRIDRIETSIKVDLGTVKVRRWRHYVCRPARVYRHTTGASWTAVLIARTPPKHVWRVIVGAGAAPKTCAALGLAPLRHHGGAS
jgi:hypothetical protein